jgi:multiple antibiotic resistance protein
MDQSAGVFAEVLVTLIVIMDPVGNIPVFLALTRGYDASRRRRSAAQASLVAAVVILVFAFFGQQLLSLLGVSVQALQVGGGLLLLLVALELLSGGPSVVEGESAPNVALVPLGTPLLAGPGAVAAVMLFMGRADEPVETLTVAGALVGALVVVWLVLHFAAVLSSVLSENLIHLFTRIMGLLLAAIAVQLVAVAIEEWVRTGVASG